MNYTSILILPILISSTLLFWGYFVKKEKHKRLILLIGQLVVWGAFVGIFLLGFGQSFCDSNCDKGGNAYEFILKFYAISGVFITGMSLIFNRKK